MCRIGAVGAVWLTSRRASGVPKLLIQAGDHREIRARPNRNQGAPTRRPYRPRCANFGGKDRGVGQLGRRISVCRIKRVLLHRHRWAIRAEARRAIFAWIAATCIRPWVICR